MSTAVAGIGPGNADIVHISEMVIVDDAEIRTSRQVDDHRPGLLQVEHRAHVRRVGIAGEQNVPGATRQDHHIFIVLSAGVACALECAFHRDGGIKEPIGMYGVLVVLFVLNAQRRFRRRVAVTEFVFLCGDLLDVRQPPRLVEQRLLRTVEAREHLEAAVGIGRDPVRFLARRRRRAEVDVSGAVGVLLQPRRSARSGPTRVAFRMKAWVSRL